MNLPGYEPDRELAEQLLDLREAATEERRINRAKQAAFGIETRTDALDAFSAALIGAWDAGRLLPTKNLTLSEEDTQNAI